MLRARDLDDLIAVVDREQRQEAREVAVERNVLQHVTPRRAYPARDVVQRAVREPSGRELQRQVLQAIHT